MGFKLIKQKDIKPLEPVTEEAEIVTEAQPEPTIEQPLHPRLQWENLFKKEG